ncbi:MAG: hypothetical protein KG003_07015 [Bacteroidetes bacterium]|nr:hypothetical protein [Bacteroidota bacterium]
MKNKSILAIMLLTVFIAACNESSKTRYLDIAKPASETQTSPVPNQTDVTKMLREASLKFRVKNVNDVTGTIEKMTIRNGGYVAQSMYDIEESENIIRKVSTDSAEEVKKLLQRNHMEVFVLNSKLDSFLDGIAKLVDHLEFRHITAYDVNMESASDAADKYVSGTNTSTKNGTISYSVTDESKSEPEQKTSFKSHQWASSPAPADAKLRKKFARVTMDIYQTPVVKKWTIPNPDSFEVARGGFFSDFGSSLKTGWRGLALFFNYLVSLWPLILVLAAGIVFWKRRKKGLKLFSFKK